ncbi:MAG: hypothetical protein QOG53_3180, partial [Frankiales bacterium]|nr:hypothetical protein [Frankiales bacterium]
MYAEPARLTGEGADEPGVLRCGPTQKAGGYWYTFSPRKTVWHLDGDV